MTQKELKMGEVVIYVFVSPETKKKFLWLQKKLQLGSQKELLEKLIDERYKTEKEV